MKTSMQLSSTNIFNRIFFPVFFINDHNRFNGNPVHRIRSRLVDILEPLLGRNSHPNTDYRFDLQVFLDSKDSPFPAYTGLLIAPE